MNQPQMPSVVPFTKSVRALVLINLAVWVVLVLILQGMILKNSAIFDLFALQPGRVIKDFYIWQIVTYMFLHSNGVFHVLFNMLVLWWFGAELEARWGTKFFLTYYLVCGIGAGLIYCVGTLLYVLAGGSAAILEAPLVGASGATYGLLLAYGILFGERVIFFMMLFPMKAKFFTLIIGLVELVTLMDSGMGSQTANLAHLGGIVVGFAFLSIVARMRARQSSSGGSFKRGRRLKLVVNNDLDKKQEDTSGPKYWN